MWLGRPAEVGYSPRRALVGGWGAAEARSAAFGVGPAVGVGRLGCQPRWGAGPGASRLPRSRAAEMRW
jgi:hypothetical protein